MPEGPEVRIISEQLGGLLVGTTLRAFVYGPQLQRLQGHALETVWPHLPAVITAVWAHGKRIFIQCGTFTIVSWLGMAGKWATSYDTHTRGYFVVGVPVRLPDDSLAEQLRVVYYNDTRFGNMRCLSTNDVPKYIAKELGPDLLTDEPDEATWLKRWHEYITRYHRRALDDALLDQTLYAGVGNYIKAEACYRAQLLPTRSLVSLTDNDLLFLRYAVCTVIRDAYHAGGTTLRDYITPTGATGGYQTQFKVYAQKTDPIGHEVTRDIVKGERTNHYCKICQT